MIWILYSPLGVLEPTYFLMDAEYEVGDTGDTAMETEGMGIMARALAKHQSDVERDLRDKGLLTRDSRISERKKPGQPGARKRFQFSKR